MDSNLSSTRIPLRKSLLRPVSCDNLVRLGTTGDGGYVVPGNEIHHIELLVSLGLSDNWEFDADFLERNPRARVVGVDHTVGPWWFTRRVFLYSWKVAMYSLLFNRQKAEKYRSKRKNNLRYFSFFKGRNVHLKRRVSARTSGVDMRLADIFEAHLARDGRCDVFLKMDIEGGEYEATEDIVRFHRRVRCISGEFHDLDRRTTEFNECLERLSQHFAVVHVHGNNGAPYDGGNDFPSVVEISFINRSLLSDKTAFSKETLPRAGLDFPNNPAEPDYNLRFD